MADEFDSGALSDNIQEQDPTQARRVSDPTGREKGNERPLGFDNYFLFERDRGTSPEKEQP